MDIKIESKNYNLSRLGLIGEQLREALFTKNCARDAALSQSRALIRLCANSIRAIHRDDMKDAELFLDQAKEL